MMLNIWGLSGWLSNLVATFPETWQQYFQILIVTSFYNQAATFPTAWQHLFKQPSCIISSSLGRDSLTINLGATFAATWKQLFQQPDRNFANNWAASFQQLRGVLWCRAYEWYIMTQQLGGNFSSNQLARFPASLWQLYQQLSCNPFNTLVATNVCVVLNHGDFIVAVMVIKLSCAPTFSLIGWG